MVSAARLISPKERRVQYASLAVGKRVPRQKDNVMSYDDDVFEDTQEAAVPRRTKSPSTGWTCLAITLATGGLAMLLVCCGGGGALMWFGMNIISAEIEDQLRENETLKQHVGVVESFSLDFTRTAAKNDSDEMVFHVKGSQGSGYVTVVSETNNDGDEEIRTAVLRLPDGKEIPLVP